MKCLGVFKRANTEFAIGQAHKLIPIGHWALGFTTKKNAQAALKTGVSMHLTCEQRRFMTGINREPDPVRSQTSPESLQKIDQEIESKIRYYANQPSEAISKRIGELEREWDIERFLETNAASLALLGMTLGIFKKRYLLFSATVLGFLLMHATQGWCPPVPVLRKFGVRTRSEIDREKYALKVLRGDFKEIARNPDALKQNPAENVLKVVAEG